MGIAIIIAISAAIASAGAQMASMSAMLSEQDEMMRNQELENSYKDVSQKNQTLDQMKTALETNEAYMSTTGMASNSPSFVSMNADTIEEGDKAMRNADTAEALNDYTLKIQQVANQRKAWAQGIGTLAGLGTSLATTGISSMSFGSTPKSIYGSTSSSIDNMFNKTAEDII